MSTAMTGARRNMIWTQNETRKLSHSRNADLTLRRPTKQGVSKDASVRGVLRALWSVLRDAPRSAALLGTRGRLGRATKWEESFRETLRPLKSLKTAKSRNFRPQRYQALSKTHDFAGEAFSLPERNRKFHIGAACAMVREPQKFGKTPDFDKKLASPHKPLKRNKCDKEIFGNVWQKRHFSGKIWVKNLAA
jgi:hypothetical protein